MFLNRKTAAWGWLGAEALANRVWLGAQQETLSHHVPKVYKGAQTPLPVVFHMVGLTQHATLMASGLAVVLPVPQCLFE